MELKEKELLKVENLTVDFKGEGGKNQVVKQVSISVPKGKIVALVGESGSGKSVTALSMMNLLPESGTISSGSLTIDGQTRSLPKRHSNFRKCPKDIGLIFQNPIAALNPLYTVGEQLIETIVLCKNKSKAEAEESSKKYLESVNLPNPEYIMNCYPFQLSGGMCQRVMIAMAMALETKYLIADEPTTALDVTVQKKILNEIYCLSREENLGVLFITHDLGVVAEIADYVYIMKDGEIVEQNEVSNIFEKPEHAYTKKLLGSIL